jgi:NodT family efflux transporter outer membrane factor (OMF) lipoprotein
VTPMKTLSHFLAGGALVALAGGALAALTGCNFAPHYEPPKTDATAPFKEAGAAQGWKPADPRDTAIQGNWWELYQDPQLNALEERVAISNQTVAAAEANYRAARALAGEAEAGFFPTLSVDPSVVRSRASASGSGSSSGSATPSSSSANSKPATKTTYTLPLEASYELDLWGRVRNQAALGEANAAASAADVATALLSTHSQLAQDYFQLRAVDEQRRILDTTLNDYQASLHLVTTLYDNGLASDEDLAEANTQLKSAQAAATDLGVARAQYEHAIAVLIGVAPAQFSLAVTSFHPILPAVPVGLPSDLLERRPDIAAAERRVFAANAGIGIARAAYFPSLTISASAGYEASALSKLFDWPNRFWSVGPALAETLFDGGARSSATAQAHAQYDAAVADYRQTVLTAFQAVEDNLTSLRILALEEGQQHSAALSAQREVELSAARFKLGLDSYVNVITAQNTFLTSREAELQVQVRQIAANINLIDNVGGGWDISQRKDTAKTALHPPGAGQPAVVPPDNAASVPNPPPLPSVPPDPADLLKQNADDMSR